MLAALGLEENFCVCGENPVAVPVITTKALCFLFIYLYLFLLPPVRRGRVGEKEEEKHQCERETSIACLLYAP